MPYIDLRDEMAKAAADIGASAKLGRWGINQNLIHLYRQFGAKASIVYKVGDGTIERVPIDKMTFVGEHGTISVQHPRETGARLNLPFRTIQGIDIKEEVDTYIRTENGTTVHRDDRAP